MKAIEFLKGIREFLFESIGFTKSILEFLFENNDFTKGVREFVFKTMLLQWSSRVLVSKTLAKSRFPTKNSRTPLVKSFFSNKWASGAWY